MLCRITASVPCALSHFRYGKAFHLQILLFSWCSYTLQFLTKATCNAFNALSRKFYIKIDERWK